MSPTQLTPQGQSYPDQGPQSPEWKSTNPQADYNGPGGPDDAAPDPTLAPHKPLGISELKSGKIFLMTEGRVYEFLNGKWAPTVFAEQEGDPNKVHERTAARHYNPNA